MNVFPLLSKYSITIERRSLILYGLLSLFTFGAGIGCGVAAWVSWDLRSIIAQNTINKVVLESMKVDARDLERQARLMESKCLEGKL